ncbi:MAG: hypothetical protein HDS42_06325 [Bacteroides sp.]|nr:hypothetical protein [Bacteroides sp.]
METKLNRIAAFIDSLPEESRMSGVHSVVLATGFDEMGSGDVKNETNCISNCHNCINQEKCEGLSNGGDCRNENGGCVGSSNGGSCFNEMKHMNYYLGCS